MPAVRRKSGLNPNLDSFVNNSLASHVRSISDIIDISPLLQRNSLDGYLSDRRGWLRKDDFTQYLGRYVSFKTLRI